MRTFSRRHVHRRVARRLHGRRLRVAQVTSEAPARRQQREPCRRATYALVLGALVLLGSARAARADSGSAGAAATLGRGVDLRLGSPKAQCASGSEVLRRNPSGSLSSSFGASFERLLSAASGAASASFDLGLFGASARVDYLARVGQVELSTAYVVQFESRRAELVLARPALTAAGAAALPLSDAERFARCGDSFISALDIGARLLLSAVLHFDSREELERFVTRVRVEALFGLAHSTRDFVAETQSFAQSAYLQVVALQEGGQPAALQAVLGPASGATCRLDDVERCLALYRALLAYAARVPEQFHPHSDASEWAVLGAHTTRYGDSDLEALAAAEPALERGAAFGLAQLSRQRASVANQLARLEFLLQIVSPARRAELAGTSEALLAQRSALDAALGRCRAAASRQACAAEAEAAHDLETFDLHF